MPIRRDVRPDGDTAQDYRPELLAVFGDLSQVGSELVAVALDSLADTTPVRLRWFRKCAQSTFRALLRIVMLRPKRANPPFLLQQK